MRHHQRLRPPPCRATESSLEMPGGQPRRPPSERRRGRRSPRAARHRVVVTIRLRAWNSFPRRTQHLPGCPLVVLRRVARFSARSSNSPQRPPIFALVIVGLLDFVLTLASIHTALTSTRIVVGNGVHLLAPLVLGMGRVRQCRSPTWPRSWPSPAFSRPVPPAAHFIRCAWKATGQELHPGRRNREPTGSAVDRFRD